MENMKVLIADEASFIRMLLENAIRNMGFSQIYFAEDVLEAVNKANELKPDFVTLEITMSEMDGLKAIKKILEVSPETKIIIVSKIFDHQIYNQVIADGAKEYVMKPFDSQRIEEAFKILLGRL